MKIKNKKALTFIELIISVTITIILLTWLMFLLSDLFSEIWYSNQKTKIISATYEIESKAREIKNNFLSGSILIDNNSWVGSDILLFKTIDWETEKKWYIFALVDFDTMKVDPNNNIDNIWNKRLAYRKVNQTELNELEITPLKIYNYGFNLDEIFEDIVLKDFQINTYNSWTILEFELQIYLNYNKKSDINNYSEVLEKDIEKIVFSL
jgi:hypothetical protein